MRGLLPAFLTSDLAGLPGRDRARIRSTRITGKTTSKTTAKAV